MIGTALVLLFSALALSGALARAGMARSHRDANGFAIWCGVGVVIVLFALSGIFLHDTWSSVYDSLSSFMSSK